MTPLSDAILELGEPRCMLADFPHALRVIAEVMQRGRATHTGQDWRNLPASFHLERARRHLDLLSQGDTTEPHLAHAATRLLMSLELLQGKTAARDE